MLTQYQSKVPIILLCSWVMISRSTYYYKPSNGKRGIAASTHTVKTDGELVDNWNVVEWIKLILRDVEYYGYEKTTWELHDLGFIINKKKVY